MTTPVPTTPSTVALIVRDGNGQSPGAQTGGRLRTARLLSLVTASIATIAAAWTFTNPGLLHGPEAMQGSARGTALVMGALAVPVLLASVRQVWRDHGSALLTWAGALLHLLYNVVLLMVLTPFNAAFLVYVELLGFALWSLAYLGASPELWRVGKAIAEQAPVRGVAYPTPMLAGTGVQTNALYIQDLAVWLPLAAVAALWLRRRQPRGAVIVGALLGLWVIEGVSVATDQWFGVQADPGSSLVSLSLVGPFLALAAIGLVPLWLPLRGSATATRGRRSPTG